MIADKLDTATASAEDAMSSMGEYIHRGTDRITHMVDEQPGQSLLVACLAGFGLGLLLSRIVPSDDSSSSLGFDRSTAERIGRNLLDKVEHALPSMLRDRLS